MINVYEQKLQDGSEIDLKLLGEALSGENEVIEVCLCEYWLGSSLVVYQLDSYDKTMSYLIKHSTHMPTC